MKKTAVIAAVIFVLAALIAISFDRLAIFAASRYSGIRISYSGLARDASGRIIIKALDIEDAKNGLGLTAKKAAIRPPVLKSFLKDGLGLVFELDNANFRISSKSHGGGSDVLRDIALIPFEGAWNYSKISGEIAIMRGETKIKNFSALSRDIRLTLDGALYGKDLIEARVKIAFSKSVIEKFPAELTNVVMREEPDGWKVVSIDLKGDPRKPSITFSGKLFRLNITNK